MMRAPRSDSELALAAPGRGFDFAWGMMIGEGFWFMVSVIVRGRAVLIRGPEVHPAGMLTGTTAISGHATRPAFASAGRAAVHVKQGLVFRFRVGVRRERPHFADGFAHKISG